MKFFSIFSGIGGFEYGINKSKKKMECIGYSEIDKYAEGIYKHHYQEKGGKNYGDATQINTNSIPDFDLLVGGFPCQAFSIAGKRRGFDDTRGTLFFEISRILKDKGPRYFCLENVKGLLSHDKGKTFQTILEVLTNLGYGVEWQVLNSKNFGVPQNRERIFIIGHLGGFSGGQIFPIRATSKENNGEIIHPTITGAIGRQGSSKEYIKSVKTIKEVELKKINTKKADAQRVFDPTDGLSCTLKALGGGQGAKTGLYAIPTTKENNAHCIDCNYHKGVNELNKGRRTQIVNDYGIRRLTPVECERLQGFPDNYTKYGIINGKKVKISDTQRYKCLGNAVTTNVVKEIFNKF